MKSDPDHVLCLPEKRITDPIQITRGAGRDLAAENGADMTDVHIQERGGQETTEIDIHGPDSVNSTGTIEDLKS